MIICFFLFLFFWNVHLCGMGQRFPKNYINLQSVLRNVPTRNDIENFMNLMKEPPCQRLLGYQLLKEALPEKRRKEIDDTELYRSIYGIPREVDQNSKPANQARLYMSYTYEKEEFQGIRPYLNVYETIKKGETGYTALETALKTAQSKPTVLLVTPAAKNHASQTSPFSRFFSWIVATVSKYQYRKPVSLVEQLGLKNLFQKRNHEE